MLMSKQINNHTITFKSLNNVDMVGIYNPFATSLGKVIDVFFDNYDCKGVNKSRIDIISKELGDSVFKYNRSTLMSNLGFGVLKNTVFYLELRESGRVNGVYRDAEEDILTDKIIREIRGDMQIHCKTLVGAKYTFNVDVDTRIGELKLLVRRAMGGMPRDQQRLLFEGRQLDDERNLGECGIKKESVIFIVLRLKGGMFAESSGRNGGFGSLNSVVFMIESDDVGSECDNEDGDEDSGLDSEGENN